MQKKGPGQLQNTLLTLFYKYPINISGFARTNYSREKFFKVGLSPSEKMCVVCSIESPLKRTKNAFYFILKLFSFSRYLGFHHDFLFMQKKRLDQEDKVNFKIHDVTTWLTNNGKHILPNISGSKRNHTMKLGQFIDYNKRNIFL